jgi:hypothetical protein
MIINPKLGGVEIALQSAHTAQQDFEPILAERVQRLANGGAVKQTSWSGKLRIITSGTGNIPTTLQGLDYSSVLQMDCCAPLSVHSLTTAIQLPIDITYNLATVQMWRRDVSLIAHALVGGVLVPAQILTIASSLVTVASVSGATGYQVSYWPRFLVFASRPQELGGARGYASRSWSFVAEQI